MRHDEFDWLKEFALAASGSVRRSGPARAPGRKFSAPTSRTVPISRTTKVPPGTGKVPALGGDNFFLRQRARQRQDRDDHQEAADQASRGRAWCCSHGVVARVRPAKALPLLPVPEAVGVEDFAEAVRPGVVQSGQVPIC